jgi:hypothetical protein
MTSSSISGTQLSTTVVQFEFVEGVDFAEVDSFSTTSLIGRSVGGERTELGVPMGTKGGGGATFRRGTVGRRLGEDFLPATEEELLDVVVVTVGGIEG